MSDVFQYTFLLEIFCKGILKIFTYLWTNGECSGQQQPPPHRHPLSIDNASDGLYCENGDVINESNSTDFVDVQFFSTI